MGARKLRVAVVGTGAWWGREHARVFSGRPDTELCAIVGRTLDRTEQRARDFAVPAYVDLARMLERERP
ncbi:MAG TPA: Gfo/Idh/MocA family oxidoreductase, partial [Catenuloplanes sp.]